jgi:hypothetical protein
METPDAEAAAAEWMSPGQKFGPQRPGQPADKPYTNLAKLNSVEAVKRDSGPVDAQLVHPLKEEMTVRPRPRPRLRLRLGLGLRLRRCLRLSRLVRLRLRLGIAPVRALRARWACARGRQAGRCPLWRECEGGGWEEGPGEGRGHTQTRAS